MAAKKNAAAVELARRRAASLTPEERSAIARLGGIAGGKARAEKLAPEERSEAARAAAKARWAKAKKKNGKGKKNG
jgi:hypothetical protein